MASEHEDENDFHRTMREHALREALRALVNAAPPEPHDEPFRDALGRARELLETS